MTTILGCMLNRLDPTTIWAMSDIVKDQYKSFASHIQSTFARRRGRPNLLRHQRETLSWLQDQDDFVVINCDKNLGPAIIEKERYVALVTTHLLTTRVYTRLDPPRQARAALHRS
jgi:nicotinamide riboside kinase